jgi:pimeloyl-ACP methyl ester carboxylesterase
VETEGSVDRRIAVADGRTICFADYGGDPASPVLWCHGGPGSRKVQPHWLDAIKRAGFRLISIDRPGYGGSSPKPGRTIGDWADDAIAVADRLDIERFFIVGVSTGGAYAVAVAAREQTRVRGAIACCAITDMRWAAYNAMPANNDRIWACTRRDEAIAVAFEAFGADGSQMMKNLDVSTLFAPADLAMLAKPEYSRAITNDEAFAQGVIGYVDDRMADSPREGWASFDPAEIECPVIVVHGAADRLVPVVHARHTAVLVPRAQLRIYPDHGHISIVSEVVPSAMNDLRELARA